MTADERAEHDENGNENGHAVGGRDSGGDDSGSGAAGIGASRALPPEVERWRQQADSTFWGLVGCEIASLSERRAVVALDIKPSHLNLIGIVHGGVYATMIDSAMGLAAMMARPQEDVVTSGLHLSYLAPIGHGRLTVTADIAHQSRKTITVQAQARTDSGELLALGTGSFRVIGWRTGSAGAT